VLPDVLGMFIGQALPGRGMISVFWYSGSIFNEDKPKTKQKLRLITFRKSNSAHAKKLVIIRIVQIMIILLGAHPLPSCGGRAISRCDSVGGDEAAPSSTSV